MLKLRKIFQNKKTNLFNFFLVFLFSFIAFSLFNSTKITQLLTPTDKNSLTPLQSGKGDYEVFGFAPYWNINKLGNVDFSVLTTFAYFGVPVNGDGTLDTTNIGYQTFQSKKATELFRKAHANGTRVVLTLTQMDNDSINQLMDDPSAQKKLTKEAVATVVKRGIDGINVDFEYIGNPGEEYRQKFSKFVRNLTQAMHAKVPASQVTVSVYASAVKDPKIYDIAQLAQNSDGIFMMAYDFATTSSNNVMPTSPLYGYKEKKYWYDVSTAVKDFLTVMPAEKLILGLPWYGYNYPVDAPAIKAPTQQGYYTYYWYKRKRYSQYVAPPRSMAQTYAAVKEDITPALVTSYKTGWDEYGQVRWKAYQEDGTWRMIFLEDEKSLGIKYDFAKQNKLGGVGMWALGFEQGAPELWSLLGQKFGEKLAQNYLVDREISDVPQDAN